VAHARRATARAAAAGDQPGLYPACGSAHGDVVLPQLHTVVEFALPKEFALLGNPALLRTPIGQETVNGIATTKYTIEEALPGGHIAGSLWLSRDGIPMRAARRQARQARRSALRGAKRIQETAAGRGRPVARNAPGGTTRSLSGHRREPASSARTSTSLPCSDEAMGSRAA